MTATTSEEPPPPLRQLADDQPSRELTVTLLTSLVDEAKGAALALYGPDAQLSPLIAESLAEHVERLRTNAKTLGVERYHRPHGGRRNYYPTVPLTTLQDADRFLARSGHLPPIPDSISALVEEALRAKLDALRAAHNDGEPFPAYTGRLRSGRRRRTPHAD